MKEKKIIIIQIISLIIVDQIFKIILLITKLKINTTIGIYINTDELIRNKDNILYIMTNIIIAIILVKYVRNNNVFIKFSNKIVVSFAIAGVITNTIDRIWKGCVIVYINIPNLFSINLGYIYIIIAWVGLAMILTKNTVNQIKETKGRNSGKNNS